LIDDSSKLTKKTVKATTKNEDKIETKVLYVTSKTTFPTIHENGIAEKITTTNESKNKETVYKNTLPHRP
jgi:hypothetical protein